jgi:hypothetical protein
MECVVWSRGSSQQLDTWRSNSSFIYSSALAPIYRYFEFPPQSIWRLSGGRFPRQIFESTYSRPISGGETTSGSHARLTCSPTAAGLESATHRLLHIQPDL